MTVEETRRLEVGDQTIRIAVGEPTVTVEVGDPTVSMRVGDPTVSIEVGEPTTRIEVGEQTTRIEVGEQTTRIEVGEPTTRTDVGEQTTRIEIGDHTVRLRPSVAAEQPTEIIDAPPTHTVVLPKVSTDPLDELVDRIRPTLTRAVDALQVAAALEADGFTDRIAKVEYGFSDVFALAAEVFHRLGPPDNTFVEPILSGHARRDSVRLVAHGPLYALPAAVFPAVLALLGQRSVVLALVVASMVGWMVAGTVAYASYRLLGAYRPRAAAKVLRISTLAAPLVGASAGLAVIAVAGGGWGLAALAAGQLSYQLAATVMMFYRREEIQAATMAPAVLAGVAYLVGGAAARPLALITAVAGLAACYGAALWLTRGRGERGEPKAGPLRPRFGDLSLVTCYGLCSAALLLHAEAPYLLSRLDIAIAVAPLIASMGFVEWRAERFRAEAVRLTRGSHAPVDFGRRMWMLVSRETVACLGVAALLGLGLIAALHVTDRLSGPAALMIAAHVVLGGAYYPAFILAGFERFGLLCAFLIAAMAVHLGVGAWLGAAPLLGQTGAPLTDTALYLGSTIALLGLFLLGLAPILGQVRHYR